MLIVGEMTNDENIVQGCHRVTLEAEQPRLCGMETISLDEKGPGPERPSEAKKKKMRPWRCGHRNHFC